MPDPDAQTTMPLPTAGPGGPVDSEFLRTARRATANARAEWERLQQLVERET